MLTGIFQSWVGGCPTIMPPSTTAYASTYGLQNCSDSTFCWIIKQKICIWNTVISILRVYRALQSCCMTAMGQLGPLKAPSQNTIFLGRAETRSRSWQYIHQCLENWRMKQSYRIFLYKYLKHSKEPGWLGSSSLGNREEEEWIHCLPGKC